MQTTDIKITELRFNTEESKGVRVRFEGLTRLGVMARITMYADIYLNNSKILACKTIREHHSELDARQALQFAKYCVYEVTNQIDRYYDVYNPVTGEEGDEPTWGEMIDAEAKGVINERQ